MIDLFFFALSSYIFFRLASIIDLASAIVIRLDPAVGEAIGVFALPRDVENVRLGRNRGTLGVKMCPALRDEHTGQATSSADRRDLIPDIAIHCLNQITNDSTNISQGRLTFASRSWRTSPSEPVNMEVGLSRGVSSTKTFNNTGRTYITYKMDMKLELPKVDLGATVILGKLPNPR